MPEKAAFSNFHSRFRFTSGEKSGLILHLGRIVDNPKVIRFLPDCPLTVKNQARCVVLSG
jgi:hypothetical protein